VTVVINNVPRQAVAERAPGSPFVVHGLLRHEHKQTVLHFVVQRNTEYTEPVRAKVGSVALCSAS
jgi:pre-rRNA-processing protein TSR1